MDTPLYLVGKTRFFPSALNGIFLLGGEMHSHDIIKINDIEFSI